MRATLGVEEIFGTRGRVNVLRVLSAVRVPLNAAQVARSAGLTRAAAGSVLRDLEAMRLVGGNRVGWARVYWLLRDSVYVAEVVAPVFRAEEAMGEELVADLRRLFAPHCISVVIFGSYARDEQTEESDIDVVLVASDENAKREVDEVVFRESPAFYERWGAPLSALVYDRSRAAALHDDAPSLYSEIERDGILVSGLLPLEWSKHAQG